MCWPVTPSRWIWIHSHYQSAWLAHHPVVHQDLGVHLRDVESLFGRCRDCQILFLAAEDLARAEAPEVITRGFMAATMTALKKKDGGVRGIATGTSFCRLVAKSLARQFGKAVEAACAPFQFALSTRAGTDCVGHAIRAMAYANPECTVLPIDGVGAYDHVLRSSFLTKLNDVPSLRDLLPFVRSICARTTTYVWEDGAGVRHRIQQAEGGEQGNPLMPLLFSLGIHDSLREVRNRLRSRIPFLLIWITCRWCLSQTGFATCTMSSNQQLMAGLGSNSTPGKPECGISQASVLPEWTTSKMGCGAQKASRFSALRSVRQSSCTVSLRREWKTSRNSGRQARGRSFCSVLGHVATTCFAPCHASQSAECAQQHDEGMWQAMGKLLGGLTGTEEENVTARHLASLPMRFGGLGLRSASRMAPAAFWFSWADALQMIHERLPQVAQDVLDGLNGVREAEGCIRELRDVTVELDRHGFVGRPAWADLVVGVRPPPANAYEPGEWAHGWQYFASSASEYFFRETTVLRQSCPSSQAHLRSHSRAGSSNVLHGCPTSPEFTVAPELFRTLILERLRLPLAVVDVVCECGAPVDSRGRHRAACPHSGRLRTRAVAPEKTLARINREAGATVRPNVKLREMNVVVRADDARIRTPTFQRKPVGR